MERQINRLIPRLSLRLRRSRRIQPAPKPRGQSEFPLQYSEVLIVAAAVGMIVAHAVRLGSLPGLWDWPALLVVMAAAPIADFVSGMIHWTFDTWGSEKTFFIGSRMIRPFRVHHTKPKDLLGSHFFTTNSDASMANIPILLLAFCIPLSWGPGPLISLFLACLGTFGLPTSQIHKWSHMARPPLVVDWLQRLGLILGREHHAVHHAPPHTINYCITTGWCNPLLRRIGFFPKLERVVATLTGWTPRADEHPVVLQK